MKYYILAQRGCEMKAVTLRNHCRWQRK